jgi:hypothetical protein
MADFALKQDDTLSALTATLENAAGNAVNLTSADIVFQMRLGEGSSWVVNSSSGVTITSATGGTVRKTWTAAQTDTPGLYYSQWVVTWSSGVQRFPNGSWDTILIHPST